VLLAVLNGGIDQLCVLLLLGRGEDQGRVGGGILGGVLGNGRKVTRVADDNLSTLSAPSSGAVSFVHAGSADDMSDSSGGWSGAQWGTHGARGLELVERVGHGECSVLWCVQSWV
jgi:hypothetical protein